MFTMSNTLINAISWTLVHTIWQGFILAFVSGIVILTSKKRTSNLRYNLLSGLFFCFIIAVGLTFNYEYQNYDEAYVKSLKSSEEQLNAIWTVDNGTVFNHFSIRIIDFLNVNANTIVLIWFIIFCIKAFQITNNMRNIYIIRNYSNQSVSEYWNEKLRDLSNKMRLKKSIILLESHLIKVPSVTGFFKPIILMPIGLISHLPQDQIEAILLHELAHIKRKDYLVNWIQCFVEIIFFFNPGMLWVSSLIKEERENCCDDMAVSIIQCKAKFVHALISSQEYNTINNNLIMGFGEKKNHLLNRAKRIIMNDSKSLNNIEKTFLSVAILTVIIILCTFGKTTIQNSKQEKNSTYHEAKFSSSTLFSKYITNGLISECYVAPFQFIIEEESLAEEARKNTEKITIEHRKQPKINDLNPESKSEIISSKTTTTTNFERKTVTTIACKPTMIETISIDSDKTIDSPDELSSSIIDDLTSAKIISGKNNLSYSLSRTKLVVNGVLQSDTVHKKFKQKYLNHVVQKNAISANISINYNYEISNSIACN